ncbi:Major inner capsid protein VP2, partial [Frankliniella fusca]
SQPERFMSFRYFRCLRMDTDSFEYLLGKVTPLIQKADTHLRRSIPPDERPSLTLRHIATGSYNLLSRARRCSENAFGVLGARFQIYRAAMRYDPDDAVTIIVATICLHNWLRSQAVGRAMYTPSPFIDFEDELAGEVIEGEWRAETANGIVNFCGQGGNRHANDALQLREMWCEYFNGVGAVPWQDRMVRPGVSLSQTGGADDGLTKSGDELKQEPVASDAGVSTGTVD